MQAKPIIKTYAFINMFLKHNPLTHTYLYSKPQFRVHTSVLKKGMESYREMLTMAICGGGGMFRGTGVGWWLLIFSLVFNF